MYAKTYTALRRGFSSPNTKKCLPVLLLIDNYDSFTYNLVHYLGSLGADACCLPAPATPTKREFA